MTGTPGAVRLPGRAPARRLWAAVALGYFSLGAGLQLLPRHLTEQVGTTEAVVPVLVCLPFLASAAARPLAGRLAARGAARRAVCGGAVAVAVGAAAQAVATGPAIVAAARLLVGVGEGLLFSGALPWVLGAAPPERRGRVAGWFGLSMWSGLTLGPAAAAALGALDGRTGDAAAWVLMVAAPVVAATLVGATPGQVRASEPTPRAVAERASGPRRRRGPTRTDVTPGLYLGLVACGYGVVVGVLALHLRARDLPDGASLAVLAAAFLVVRAVGSPAVDRWGPARPAMVLAVVQAGALALVPAVTSVPGALAVSAAVGAGVALAYPCAVALTLALPASRPPAVAIGITTSCWDLGLFASGLGAGALAAAWGTSAAFVAASVACAAAAALLAGGHSPGATGWGSSLRSAGVGSPPTRRRSTT